MTVARLLAHDDVGAGRAVVLIHGHPFDRRMWASQLSTLGRDFRVLAPDLSGYGDSPALGQTVTMGELADGVAELIEDLALGPVVLVGLSMGGLVTMELGLRAPERIAGVVLAATTAAPVTGAEAHTRRETAEQLESDGMLDHALWMAGKLFGPRARRDPAIVEPVLSMMLRTPPAGAAAALRGRVQRPDYRALLADLRVPALVIAGDHDEFCDEMVLAELVAALPGPDVVRLAGCGHLPNLEDPDGFDRAVRTFVAGLS